MTIRALTAACVLLTLPGACASSEADDDDGSGTDAATATSTATAADTSDATADNTTTAGTSTDGGTSTADTSGGASTTGGQACDLDDPDMVMRPMFGNQPGDPCCTEEVSCSGMESDGTIPQEDELGELMKCEGGKWVVDPDSDWCTDCPPGTSYIGCFWYGPLRECGCQ